MKLPRNLAGIVFGRLTALQKANRDSYWICLCACGVTKDILRSSLVSGKTNSCGCLRREKMTTHGMHLTPEYSTWEGMISRCNNPNNSAYNYYGGAGITVCADWYSFSNFIRDMGKRPEVNFTLDRKNPILGYCKENCQWMTRAAQQQNKKKQSNNKSGITGVFFQETKGFQYWVASWSVEGKNFTKLFSVEKLGAEEAFQAATSYRRIQLQKLRDNGVPYSWYHGLSSEEIQQGYHD